MAVQRYSAKPAVFEWEGISFGLRLPNTEEMIKITAARDAYFATINQENPLDGADQTKLVAFQRVVGETLACDPDDAKNPWFAESREKQAELEKNKVFKDVADDMPSSFFTAATEFFNATITRANLTDEDRKKYDAEMEQRRKETEGSGEPKAGDLEATATRENGTPTIPTPPNSDDSASVSPSISSAASISSTDGDTTTS